VLSAEHLPRHGRDSEDDLSLLDAPARRVAKANCDVIVGFRWRISAARMGVVEAAVSRQEADMR
jgi:hypothetical protein